MNFQIGALELIFNWYLISMKKINWFLIFVSKRENRFKNPLES
jgi:hypothetical protein